VAGLISVSGAPIAKLGGRKYYDLVGTLEMMRKVYQGSAVDGFELQLEPEGHMDISRFENFAKAMKSLGEFDAYRGRLPLDLFWLRHGGAHDT